MKRQSVRLLPLGWFGAVMGAAGLALALRGAKQVLRIPWWFSEIWALLALLGLTALLAALAVRLLRHFDAVRAEFAHPGQLAFTATLPVAVTLVAGCLAPYAMDAGRALWWTGALLFAVLQVCALARWIAGGIEPAHVNGGWMIMLLGGYPLAVAALALGLVENARWFFGVSLVATPFVMGLVLWRTVAGPALPDAQKPTWFIFLVPPSLAYALYPQIAGDTPYWVEACYPFAMVLAAALLVAARRFLDWPFGAPWSAFTFPLDALAVANVRHAAAVPSEVSQWLAVAALALAAVCVAMVVARMLLALARGTL